MSRIQYPTDFGQQIALNKSIEAKNDSLGTESVLIPYLTSQSISLDDDSAAAVTAATHDESRALLAKQAQNYTQLRDLKLAPVNTLIRSSVQFLKSMYKPNFKVLGEWGVTIDNNGKVTYPIDTAGISTLFSAIQKKHSSFSNGASPLQPYLTEKNIDLTTYAESLATALDYQQQASQTTKNAEHETQQRNFIWEPVVAHLHGIGDYLKKLYDPNTKALGQWGFIVVDSTVAPKERTSTLKPSEKITTSGVVLGSSLLNQGDTDLYIYKGKTVTGDFAIVHAGGTFGIIKGYSTITVSNPSAQATAKFKVTALK